MSKTIKGIAVMMMLGLTAVMAGASPLDGVEINHLGTNNTIVRVNGERKYNRKNEMSCRGKTKRSRLSRLKKC